MTSSDWKDLFKNSTITQAVLAVLVTGAWVFIVVHAQSTGREAHPPEVFVAVTGLVFGHYFRAKSDINAIQTRARTVRELGNGPD